MATVTKDSTKNGSWPRILTKYIDYRSEFVQTRNSTAHVVT